MSQQVFCLCNAFVVMHKVGYGQMCNKDESFNREKRSNNRLPHATFQIMSRFENWDILNVHQKIIITVTNQSIINSSPFLSLPS